MSKVLLNFHKNCYQVHDTFSFKTTDCQHRATARGLVTNKDLTLTALITVSIFIFQFFKGKNTEFSWYFEEICKQIEIKCIHLLKFDSTRQYEHKTHKCSFELQKNCDCFFKKNIQVIYYFFILQE